MKRLHIYFLAILLIPLINSCDLLGTDDVDDGTIRVNSDITTPTVWLSSKTYIVETGINIDGTTFSIEPGTTVKFLAGAYLSIGYSNNVTFTANGTAEKPIIFTSNSAVPAPGSWDGLWFYSNTLSNSSMSYCEVKYAGQGDHEAIYFDTKMTMTNCKVKYAKKIGIRSTEGFVLFSGNTIDENGTHAISINAKGVHTIGEGNLISCGSNYGIYITYSDISEPVTWREQTVPYYLESSLTINNGFTLMPGVVIKFNASGYIDFGYYYNTTFNAVGTLQKPIVFTTAASMPAPGAWQGLYFYSNLSLNSKMKFCIVEYAGKDSNRANLNLDNVNGFTIENCTIRNSSGYGIYASSSTWSNITNTFSNNAWQDIYTVN